MARSRKYAGYISRQEVAFISKLKEVFGTRMFTRRQALVADANLAAAAAAVMDEGSIDEFLHRHMDIAKNMRSTYRHLWRVPCELRTVISYEEYLQVMADVEAGMSTRAIAEKWVISIGYVNRIKRGKYI